MSPEREPDAYLIDGFLVTPQAFEGTTLHDKREVVPLYRNPPGMDPTTKSSGDGSERETAVAFVVECATDLCAMASPDAGAVAELREALAALDPQDRATEASEEGT